MSNFDTITYITDNLQSVCKGLGIIFSREYDDDVSKAPAGMLPLGQIFYDSEAFENIYNERATYAEATFRLRVIFKIIDGRDLIRKQQKWTHLIRDAMTVPVLNIDNLAVSKLISRVQTTGSEAESITTTLGAVTLTVIIRYRES